MNKFICALASNGIEASYVTNVKNGVICKGFRLGTGNVCPVIYPSEFDTVETIVAKAKKAMDEELPVFDMNLLKNKEYMLNHCYLAIQKQSEEDLIKSSYLNVEAIIRFRFKLKDDGDSASLTITKKYLDMLGVTEDEIWTAAITNTLPTLQICSLDRIFNMDRDNETCPLFVASTENGIDGAVAILFPFLFRKFCLEQNEMGCIILPSSTQEVIVLRQSVWDGSVDNLVDMVRSVNAAEVEDVLQLSPAVYRYDLFTDTIVML